MLSLGALAFTNAWLLTALAALPLLWWLLRVTPPAPRWVRFPAVRLLFRLQQEEETPAHTPLWLLLLRILLALIIILALAHPLLNPRAAFRGSGPLLLLVDNDWSAARHWQARQEAMDALIDQAERDSRPVILLTTAPPATGEPLQPSKLLRAADARVLAQAMQPLPWRADRAAAARLVEALNIEGSANIVWLSNGLDGAGAGGEVAEIARALQRFGSVRVVADTGRDLPRLLLPPEAEGGGLRIDLRRPGTAGEDVARVVAVSGDGRVLGRRELRLKDGERSAKGLLALPAELRNRVVRLYIENEASAGASALLDERWRRRPVGVVSGEARGKEETLLSEHYYLDRALAPFAEIRHGSIDELMGRELAVMVLTDSAQLIEADRAALADWVQAGGMLVRFAGPRLAAGDDDLVPVKLRRGDRIFGGAMSWTRPARLAAFEPESPFAGLAVPDDVLIRRQVLAEPAADLAEKTWARLTDGTPLVTAETRGRGWLVLIHTTANNEWSNLPISGLFVDMLQRLQRLGRGIASEGGDMNLAPFEALDGFGRLMPAPATARGVIERTIAEIEPGPGHPPGFYGTESLRRALNLSPHVGELKPIDALPGGVVRDAFGRPGEVDLQPWLLAAALLLALVDIVIGLGLRGLLTAGAGAATAGLALVLVVLPPPAGAQEASPVSDEAAIAATTATNLAYVRTGDPTVDDVSHAGLVGLGRVLERRTAVEPAGPVAVAVETDELAFFPLLYWPVTPEQRSLSPVVTRKLVDYLRGGGMILFDTRDQEAGGAGARALRRMLSGLSIPTLEPVPPEHVLTKAFYLMQRFPGRWDGGKVWVERQGQQVNDGVSSVIIGGNDWAAAWAIDETGMPMFPAVPGGEAQREQAYRFGVNLVMYALTGNYKADQVHVPTILKRLGQ